MFFIDNIWGVDLTDMQLLTLFRMGLFGATQMVVEALVDVKILLLPQICHTYPTVMKMGTLISYLKRLSNICEYCDALLEFYLHEPFLTRIHRIFLYQEMQI